MPRLLAAPTERVIAVEHDWVPAVQNARLHVLELDAAEFTVLDAGAGYCVQRNGGDRAPG